MTSFLDRLITHYLRKQGKVILPLDYWIARLVASVRSKVELQLSDYHAESLFLLAQQAQDVEGDMAEVGVYQGGSALLIHASSSHKTLHGFDTFEGLPELSKEDDPNHFRKGYYAASYESVRKFLDYPEVKLYKGLFPGTAEVVKDKRFAFVHLDMDLYEPMKAALEFFYPRMSRGGIVVIHDYPTAQGVKTACEEFFAGKSEHLITHFGKGQAHMVKL